MMERVQGFVEQLVGQAGWAGVGVALVVVVVVVAFWKFTARAKSVSPPTPPGSFGWPLVGETLEYLNAKRANNAAQFFKTRVAKFGETFTTHLFFDPSVSLGAQDGNKFLFANENTLVQNCWPPSVANLLGKYAISNGIGDDHKKLRRVITSFLNPEGLQTFVPRIDAITRDQLAKHWQGDVRGVPTMKHFTYAVASDLFVSLKETDPRFLPLFHATEDLLGGILQMPIDLPGFAYYKARVARNTMYDIFGTLIAERKQELEQGKATQRKDLLAIMLSTPDEDGVVMSDDAIRDNLNVLMFAGHDTSSTTLAMVLKYLFLNPECLAKVIQEQREIAEEKSGATLNWNDTRKMKYTWAVVQETLRVQPPVLSAFRTALHDFEFGGYTIPKGWKLFWATDRTHKDPKYFPDPEKFDPSRFEGSGPPPFVWIPFGGGPHMCPGNEFSRTEMMVFLHYITLNFEWKMVDPDESISIDPMPIFKRNMELKVWKKDN